MINLQISKQYQQTEIRTYIFVRPQDFLYANIKYIHWNLINAIFLKMSPLFWINPS